MSVALPRSSPAADMHESSAIVRRELGAEAPVRATRHSSETPSLGSRRLPFEISDPHANSIGVAMSRNKVRLAGLSGARIGCVTQCPFVPDDVPRANARKLARFILNYQSCRRIEKH